MKAGNPIQTLPPDGFVRQFFDPPPQDEAMRQRLLTTNGDTYRLRSFGLYRLEEMARYIRFPIPPLRNLHYDFLFLRTGLSVSEIAAQLGFDDVSYFSRVFRKRVGVPPLDYRQSG